MKLIKFVKTAFILSILLVSFTADSLTFRTTKIVVQTKTNEYQFYVEVAEAPDQLAQGLAGKKAIKQDSGMLFLLPNPAIASMWTKDVPFNIDIIFINEAGYVVQIHSDVLADSHAVIQSKMPVKAILELDEGTANRIGLQIGDRIINEAFN